MIKNCEKKRLKKLLMRLLPDRFYLGMIFYKNTGYRLSFKNPETFNAKLQWLKIFYRDPVLTSLVDKYEVKKFIKEKIGEEYLIPTIGIWNDVDEIDFDNLPDQYVLKCTHDSGSTVFCKDRKKFDVEEAKYILKQAVSKNYFYAGREWPYKDVKPRIMAEPYMKDKNSEYLIDYKLMCFNGKVRCSFVVTDRYSEDGLKVTFFDRDWKRMPFERHYPSDKKEIPRPTQYDNMIELAEKLSENIIFVRVDFYEIEGKIYFGELTFSPGGGFEEFRPVEWDKRLGEWITLPIEKRK